MKKYNELSVYEDMYPDFFNKPIPPPIPRYTLDEVTLRDFYSNIAPKDVNLSTKIGPVQMNFGLFSACMDSIGGPDICKVLMEIGACGIIYRHKKADIQLQWLSEVLEHKPCLVQNPIALNPDDKIESAHEILDEYGFSTIPIITDKNTLVGILFTRDVAFKENLDQPVKKFMKKFHDLRVAEVHTPFADIRNRLLNEPACSVLPLVNGRHSLKGIYFRKDCRPANPSFHNEKPLVGMAINECEDIRRVEEALTMGVGVIIVDSSHGNCDNVIELSQKVVQLVKKNNASAAVIAGNVASIDGYNQLADIGVHAVKCGIGSGSICTTSLGTGVGVPMWSLVRELAYMRQLRIQDKCENIPEIIPDGSINGTGTYVKMIAAGGHAGMAGEWLVAAQESLSAVEHHCKEGDPVPYRGMASKGAIDARSSLRYGHGKKAEEGVEGFVTCRGPLKSWIDKDKELICGGFAHTGSYNIDKLHEAGNTPTAFSLITVAGQNQMTPRVRQ
ncbi:MAG: IMP dehydrogenase [bacterium]|nr:IMP dehydrogenase [bacterium]